VADVDAVGGNSGSPVVDRDGNLVGLAFALNDAGESNTFANNPVAARAIGVSWAAIETMLRDVYGGRSLVEEMTR
jgi:V8-like Glu-specific endopeptidase